MSTDITTKVKENPGLAAELIEELYEELSTRPSFIDDDCITKDERAVIKKAQQFLRSKK